MKEKRTKTIENGGFYIILGACVLVIALIGYFSNLNSTEDMPSQNLAQNTTQDPQPLPTQKATPAQASTPKTPVEPKTTSKDPTPPAQPVSTTTDDVEDIPHFIAPVQGTVDADFSGEQLVFNNATDDWRTHDGVDFVANINDDVLAAADGIIEKIYSDSLGNCILLNHQNGYKTLYANLADIADLTEGSEVSQGAVIGKIGESALADFSEKPHLHFEILTDDKNVNPLEYIE